MKTPINIRLTLLFALFMLFTAGTVKSQCAYLSNTGAAEQVKFTLPCNFPVFDYQNQNEAYIAAFDSEVSQFKTTVSGFDGFNFRPDPRNGFFQISRLEFDNSSPERKRIILANPEVYHINN